MIIKQTNKQKQSICSGLLSIYVCTYQNLWPIISFIFQDTICKKKNISMWTFSETQVFAEDIWLL